MLEIVALAVVAATGLFLVVLGGASLAVPSRARRFLLGFAGSPGKHYAELALRLVVGGALVVSAPRMMFPGVFGLFGWVLIATTAGLLLVPWRWHSWFASRSVPAALRVLPLLGVSSLALGGLILLALLRGSAG